MASSLQQRGSDRFKGAEIRKELEDKGYVVVPDLLTLKECDTLTSQYKDWVDKFDEGVIPLQKRTSVIQTYRVGHFQQSWEVRLRAKAVFQAVWRTEKLLSSIDGIAISKPPQSDRECRDDRKDWLHLDQGAQREGLHAYQGAVYLEEQTQDDFCFRVLTKSHLYHSEFFQTFPDGVTKTERLEFYKLSQAEKDFYYKKGCTFECVPVPKGGIVLWDSRTVHDNTPPISKRPNPDRWRFVVFVSMTPAIWASEKDLEFKADAYRRMLLTSHWSSQGLKTFKEYKDGQRKRNYVNLSIDYLPDIAKTSEARLLAGAERYDFEDGNPNGPEAPKWRFGVY
ncbi:uncharacterized protein LOC125672352 isoform X2 [Ostrea edulis]|uniref:uncharacterized protein LOC125672352 isoform X2 n=1 Tax=Ostrea edulis TaxID=37623 RepID=UPI00209482A8|nr:uncharacterized protein LOC125672352 isoform X2 [Ostrea edulis]